MKTSIVIPVFNGEMTIKDTLDSVVKNTPKDVEIIVVDDGSIDKTNDITSNYLLSLKRRGILIPIKHGGPAKARNTGWDSARGDIIIFLDADCMVTEKWYEEMVNSFKNDIVAVQGSYINAIPDNIMSEYEQQQIDLRQGTEIKEIDNFATYSLAIKRKCLEEAGGFDESFETSSTEDTLLSYKILEFGKIIHNPNAKVKHYHSGSLFSYLKKQFIHGKNRVLMYKKLKFKKIGDKYAGIRILIQPFLALSSLLTVFNIFFIIPFVALLLLQLPELMKLKKLKFLTFIINILRAYSWGLGMLVGVLIIIKQKR